MYTLRSGPLNVYGLRATKNGLSQAHLAKVEVLGFRFRVLGLESRATGLQDCKLRLLVGLCFV